MPTMAETMAYQRWRKQARTEFGILNPTFEQFQQFNASQPESQPQPPIEPETPSPVDYGGMSADSLTELLKENAKAHRMGEQSMSPDMIRKVIRQRTIARNMTKNAGPQMAGFAMPPPPGEMPQPQEAMAPQATAKPPVRFGMNLVAPSPASEFQFNKGMMDQQIESDRQLVRKTFGPRPQPFPKMRILPRRMP